MTKESYFEMCELMGNEPVEEDIPVEYEDFPIEVQQAFTVYHMLRDEWDMMGGSYLGKSMVGIKDLLDISEVDASDQKFTIMLVRMIDSVRSEEVNRKISEKKEPAN